MSETLLSAAIDELIDDCADAFGDWDDVLRRAGIATVAIPGPSPIPLVWPRRRLRSPLFTRRRLVVVALVAASLTILFATPAWGLLLGLIGRHDVSFRLGQAAPLEIKRDFSDLSLGMPASLASDAVASQTRRVATLRTGGKTHVLWVAPTRGGGYCWRFDPGEVGCRRTTTPASPKHLQPGAVHPELLGVSFEEPFNKQGQQYVGQFEGDLLAPRAYSLSVVYADGSKTPLPFYYVSKPIGAGFFFVRIPSGHDTPATRAAAVELRDKQGHLLARQPFIYLTPGQLAKERARQRAIIQSLRKHGRQRPPIRRSPALPAPSAPQQRGSANGVSVVAGHNGVAVFTTSGATPMTARLIAGRLVGYGCVVRAPYHSTPVDLTFARTTLPRVAIRIDGIGAHAPFLGCEIEGGYGHTWPDRLHGHSAVEIPFTAAGRRYFADRAAARDLAIFVRSRQMHTIRKNSGATLVHDLHTHYGSAITQLASASAPLPAGRIGYLTGSGSTTFIEYSSTGRRFTITIKNGRIASQNVKPLAFVF